MFNKWFYYSSNWTRIWMQNANKNKWNTWSVHMHNIHPEYPVSNIYSFLGKNNRDSRDCLWKINMNCRQDKKNFHMLALILALLFVFLYPGFIMFVIQKNVNRIEEKKFKTAFNELFKGIFTDSRQALLYEPIFCIRRFLIVFTNVVFTFELSFNRG